MDEWVYELRHNGELKLTGTHGECYQIVKDRYPNRLKLRAAFKTGGWSIRPVE